MPHLPHEPPQSLQALLVSCSQQARRYVWRMRLEDLRGLQVGDSALVLQPGATPFTAAFHHHAEQAHWHTVNCVLRLGGDRVDGVADVRIAAVEWWRTLESLIALVHRVAILESDLGLRVHLPRVTSSNRTTALDRWSAIARWFSEGTASAPKAVTQRIVELRDFRNSFEHASRETEISVRASRLGTRPGHANLSDAVEAMAICIEAASIIRGTVTGLDLMPQCLVPSHLHVFYDALDHIAEKAVMPQYRHLVRALGVTSEIQLYPTPAQLPGSSLLEPAFILKAQPGPEDIRVTKPLDLWSALEAFADKHPDRPGAEEFRVPSYHV